MVTENPNLATPQLTDFQQYTPSGLPAPNKSREGLNSEQLAAFAKNVANNTIPGLMNTASAQELYNNRRYPIYRRGEDLENIYGRDQSWYSSMGNALVKFGATTVGTFLQGFNNIPATISAIRNQDMSKLSGEGSYEESIDNWLKNLEDEFPNYYTRFEKEHPFLGIIPFAPGSANFWGDKIIKNLGFTAGAISNAIITDTAVTALTGGTGTAPLIAAQAAKASLWLNKLFSTTNNLNRILSVEKKLLNLKSLGNLAKINKFTSGASYTTSLLGSARTEAAVESRGIYNSVKEQLIADYKLNNFGQDPQGLDLEDIENHAQNAMNTSFGINVGLLTVSNAIQFGNLFKSFNKSQNLINSLDNITLKQGVFQAITPETKAGKIWDSVKPSLKNIFSEGLYEEGGQFATEKGVSDYYTRKYLNKNSWDETSEIVNSTLKGLSEQFGSKEGYENMVIGAISSMLSGGVSSRIQKIKGTDEKTRTQKTVDILNKNRFRGTLSQQFENTANSVEIIKQMDEAVQKGDIYRYNNLKSDLFFEYVMSRSANGLHDVTIEELEGLKDLSNEEFESTFGVSFNNTNKSTVSQYVDSMISQANSIQKLANGINYAYKNPFKNPQTQEEINNFEDFERYKLNLIYLAAQQPMLNQRLEDLSNEIFNINPDVTLDLVKRLTSKEGLKELSEEYELKANSLLESINEITTPQDRRNINLRVKALQTASERTSRLSNEHNEADFNYLVNFELNAQEPGDKKIFGANATQLFNLGVDVNMIEESKKRASDLLDALSTEEGFNEFLDEQDKDIPISENNLSPKIINFKGEEEDLIVDREYEITKPKQAIVKKINDRRWEVTSPEGTLWSYHRTKKAAEASAKLQTEEFGDLNKVKILEFNPDNTIKIEDVNGNIYDIPVSRINGYQRIKTEQEALLEAKQKLDEQLKELEKNSGTVVTGDPTKESYKKESLKKSAEILFTSSISQSEKEDIVKPHIIRTNKFKNNAKNFPSYKKLKLITFSKNQESQLGLTGLVDLSMDGLGIDPKNYTDPDNGYIYVVAVIEEKDGIYFVDEKGNKLNKVGTPSDLNKVIFESMPTTSLIWKNGENRFRKGQEQEAANQAAQWKLKRNQILNSDKYEIYDFSISRGIAQIQDNSAQNPVSEVLIPENKLTTQEGLLVIPTTGTVSHKGQNYTFPNGRPILKYEDTFEPVQNNKFTKEEATVIFNVLKALSDNLLDQSAKDVVLDENYLTYLQNVLYFRKTKETSRNQIYIDTTTMEVFLGGKQYDITKIAENEEDIVNNLSENAYFAVNNNTLKNNFDKPFIEYYLENNNLVTRKWPNYQSFLLSSKTPEGKQRSFIPVTTNINIPTEAVPNNFQQKYFILEGLEFPPLEKPKEEKKQDTLGFLAKKPISKEESEKADIERRRQEELKNEIWNNSGTKFTGKSFVAKDGNIYTIEESELKSGAKVVKVKDKNGKTGSSAYFAKNEDGTYSIKGGTRVESVIEGIGLASAIYNYFDNNIGKIKRTATTTDDGDNLWNSNKNRINAKYDAELDALEEPEITIEEEKITGDHLKVATLAKKAVNKEKLTDEEKAFLATYPNLFEQLFKAALVKNTQKEPAKIEVKKEDSPKSEFKLIKRNNKLGAGEYSRIGQSDLGEDRITEEDLAILKEWHQEKVPNLPYQVLSNLVQTYDNKRAWGVYENGVAKFYRGAIRGTEYHEIMEGIWASFLTPNERQELLDEFKSQSGTFRDRESGKNIRFDEATDQQAKERIMDDFAEFRKGKIQAKSLGEKIVQFFRNIINFVKSFVNTPSKKDELFNAIEEGRFKYATPQINDYLPAYSRIGNLTEKTINEFTQDMTYRFFGEIFGGNYSLFNPTTTDSNEIFEKIRQFYIENGLIDENNENALSEEEYKGLVLNTKDYLTTFKIQFDEDNQVTINDENKTQNEYTKDPFTTNWKKSSPFAIKILLASLIETKHINQEGSLSLPEARTNSFGGVKLLNFSRGFATVMEKLSNTTDPKLFVEKLIDLARNDGDYVRLLTRLGANYSSIKNEVSPELDYGKMDADDWRTFVQFYQLFSKQKPLAYIQQINGSEVYTLPADRFTATVKERNSWINNIKVKSNDKKSIIFYDPKTKSYQVKDIKGIKIKTPKDMIDFLSKIGVEFPLEAYVRLNDKQKDKFADYISSIKEYLGKDKTILSLSGENTNVSGTLLKLADLLITVTNPNQDIVHIGIDNKMLQNHSENNVLSIFANDFNSSSTLTELLEKRPELNDVFSKNSIFLKKDGLYWDKDGNRINTIKVGYIQGTDNFDSGKARTTSSLSKADRFMQEINQNLYGRYYVLVPADGSTEWLMEFENLVNLNGVQTGSAWNTVYSTFRNYLKDEIKLAQENRKYLKNVKPRAQELRFFKDIIDSKSLNNTIDSLIKSKAEESEIDAFIQNNEAEINEAIKNAVIYHKDRLLKQLEESNRLQNITEDSYILLGLDTNFAKENKLSLSNMTNKQINDLLSYITINSIIANIEFHKTIFGDPYQFEIKKGNQLDETKRTKSFESPRRTTFDTPEYNTFLNQNINKAGEIELKPEDPGYRFHKSYFNSVIVNDVIINTPIYDKVNEADAATLISLPAFREFKLKNGQWDLNGKAEKWYQYQMAYERQNSPNYEYTSKVLENQDIRTLSENEPDFKVEVLKPIGTGSKHNKNHIDNILYKTSAMPIWYKQAEGRNLEKLYLKMIKENKDIIVMTSAAKDGIEQSHSLYTDKAEFNEEPFNNNIEVPWKIFGIQVENSYDKPKSQTWGTQFPKVATTNLYENGQVIGNDLRKDYITSLIQKDKDLRKKIFENSYNDLLNKLGIEDTGENFVLVDNVSISQLLQQQLLARDASNNIKDLVKLDENGQFRIPFEASANYIQIKDILYAQINDAFISPKVSGGAHVQVPVTLWESSKEGRGLAIKTKEGYKKISKEEYDNLSETDKKKVTLTSDTLKFYTKEDPYMEVLLPAWFLEQFPKNRFKTEADILKAINSSPDFKEILKGIGFRIPTQATSSIENFRIKGFLPSSMGTTVVVPSEITTKAGSDFDIDKLNLYLKSIYVDENGKIKLVKYLDSEKATKEHFSKVFDKRWEKEKFKKEEILEAIRIFNTFGDDPKNLLEKYHNTITNVVSSVEEDSAAEDILVKEIEKYSDQELKDIERENYIKNMYKKSLENEWFSTMDKILSLPEKYEDLISPIDDAGLEEVSKTLDDLRDDKESSIKNRLLDKTYMSNLRHAFLTGKKWVGIAAVNITAHSLFQKSEMYIDPERFHLASDIDKKFLGDGSIVLPHNQINGKPSLSGKTTVDGKELISNRLSGYGTAFVDVAKNPYILKIIKNELVVGTFMFLERLGVGENTAWFLNQPIISEYLEYLENSGERNLFKKNNLDIIRAKFPTSVAALQKAQINVKELKSNIEKYYEKDKFDSDKDNATQQLILTEFLKYSKMAEHSFKMTQATNFDTTRFRGQEDIFKKNRRVETARRTNIINSVDKLLDSTFIGDMRYWIIQSSEALGAVVKTDQYNIRDSAINPVLAQFADNEYLAADKYTNIANKIITSFVDYLVQTRTELNSNIKELLVDSSTFVANELVKAKESYPNIRILNQLEPISSPRVDGATSLKLKVKPTEAFDQNLYIEMMRELREFEPTNKLYENIVKVSLLQGTYSSPISINSIIPIEDRQKYITPIINTLSQDADFEGFTNGAFQRNNWKNDDIFYNLDLRATQNKSEYNEQQEMLEDIYNIPGKYEYSFPAFGEYFNNNEKNVFKQLNIKSRDRQLLFLSEDFDYIGTTKDFISVNRLQKSKDGNFVSVTTGKSFSGKDYKKAKEEGNLSIYDIYGYQKVKYSDGTPVTFNAKTKDGSTKMHVYKLINLWGDGIFASEYYNDNRKSVFNNGTMKTTEIPDSDIIRYYTPLPKKKTYEDEVNDAIADTKFNKPMSSNKLPLSEPMNYKMPKSENIIGKDTTTFDLIKEGLRTSTTRGYWYNVVKKGVKPQDMVGKILTFESPKKEKIDVIVKSVHKITNEDRQNAEFLNQWEQSEKWTKEHLLKETKVGEYQVKFKVLNQNTDSSNTVIPDCA